MVNDHPGGRTGQKGQGEEKRNAGVVEKVFDRRALFSSKKRKYVKRIFPSVLEKKNGKFHEEKTSRVFFYRYMRK